MRRPGAPFNSLYSKAGDSGFGALNNSFDGTYPTGGHRGQSPPSMTRRPQSAMAGYAPGGSRRLGDPPIASDKSSQQHLQTGNLKMLHLSLSRKIIELWDMLEVPAHRRQASLGSSMVLLYPTADNVAHLRALVDELEAYRITREQSSTHIFSSLGGLPDESHVGGNVYRPHPLDELPLSLRRPVSASLMRGSPNALFTKQRNHPYQQQPQRLSNGAWSRPTSALSDRSSLDDISFIAATAAGGTNDANRPVAAVVDHHQVPPKSAAPRLAPLVSAPPTNDNPSPSDDVVATMFSTENTPTATITKNRPPSAKLRSITSQKNDSPSTAQNNTIDPTALAHHISTSASPIRASADQVQSEPMNTSVAAVASPPMKGNTKSLVDASTMTIESYLVQDSAIVKELFYQEGILRHDIEEQCFRPMSKLNLLFLTRLADIEERALRGITRSEKERKASKAADGELLDAITGGPDTAGAGGNRRDEAELYALAASRIKRLMMEEAMGRIGISESAERIAEIEFAFVVTRLEEEANRESLCTVLEDGSWNRIITYFTNSLSTTLFQGLELIREAYLRRYDLEREEFFDRTAVEDYITRERSVLSWASSVYSEETRSRRAILQEEFVADAVLEGALKEAETAQRNARLREVATQETDGRFQVLEQLHEAVKELDIAYQKSLDTVERLQFVRTEERVAAARAISAEHQASTLKSSTTAAAEQQGESSSSEVQELTESGNMQHMTQSGVQRNFAAGEVLAIIDDAVRMSPQRQVDAAADSNAKIEAEE